MRPVVEKRSTNKKLLVVYIIIFIVCMIGIGISLYFGVFKDEKIGAIIGVTDEESEKEEEYNNLKLEFDTIFTNNVETLQETNLNLEKISDKFDIVATPYHYEKNEENLTLNVYIPYINVKKSAAIAFNKKITENYKTTAEKLMNQVSTINTIYSVVYKAYLQNNILSLAIRSEYKEGSNSQVIVVETFNYNLAENREVTIQELLALKNINPKDATQKIRSEIKKIQEQNEPLIEQGYNFYKRDYNSEIYEVTNCKQYLYGKNGMLYVVYPYGNSEDTSEMDVVIFE